MRIVLSMIPRVYDTERVVQILGEDETPSTARLALNGQAYTETMVTPLLRESPLHWHTYKKPYGYPVDFRTMHYIHDDARHGASSLGRILHQLGREDGMAQSVVSAKEHLKDQIASVIEARAAAGASEVKIASIGSGPAREVEEYLNSVSTLPIRVRWTFIDQDVRALRFARRRLESAHLRHANSTRMSFTRYSAQQLFNTRDLLQRLGGQDLIYSTGVLDYLPDHAARNFVRHATQALAKGGQLTLCNVSSVPKFRWLGEFPLDLRLIYRDEQTVAALAAELDRNATVTCDEQQTCYFLNVANA